jgi:hypothetical protein
VDRPSQVDPARFLLSAHLRSIVSLIEYYIQSEKHGSMLQDVKVALDRCIVHVEAAETKEASAKNAPMSEARTVPLEAVSLIIKALECGLGSDDPKVVEAKELILFRIAELNMIDGPDPDELLAIVPPQFKRK